MVRLRKLGAEFHSPDQMREGTLINMPYLTDMAAYQDYLDGDITPLFARMGGNEFAQNVTGARYYTKTGPAGYWQLNFFRAYVRYLLAAVFDRSPVAIDASEEVQKQWVEDSPALLRQARTSVEWHAAKGRGVLTAQRRVGDIVIPRAVDPKDYIPLVDPVDRDLEYGHMLLRLWYEGARIESSLPNRATVQVYIPPELAAISDLRVEEQNTTEDFVWAGNVQGVIGGRLGVSTRTRQDSVRMVGIWSFGSDDSVFKTLESNVYELLLQLSHSRTALTRDIRQTRIDPAVTGDNPVDENGNLIFDLYDPVYHIPLDKVAGDALGFLQSGAMDISAAFLQLVEISLDLMAYAANIPREAFGLNMQSNESGEALHKLQATFRTMVIDIRDDLSTILSELWYAIGGPKGIKIGWEHEPFASTTEYRNELRADYKEGIINRDFAQVGLGYPIMEVRNNDNDIQRESGTQSEDIDGRDGGESEGTED